MRVMVIIKANKDTEAGVLPSQELLTEMEKFNEELVKAGVMLAGEGLHASSKGKRVRFSGGKRIVIDGSASCSWSAPAHAPAQCCPSHSDEYRVQPRYPPAMAPTIQNGSAPD